MKEIAKFDDFNANRLSNPWVALVTDQAKLDFTKKIGGYTGAYGKGEAGALYVNDPVENQVYAYGQKDYRKPRHSFKKYVQYKNGEFVEIEPTELISVLESSNSDSN